MLCEEIMTEKVAVVRVGDCARDAARIMRDLNVGLVPVGQPDGEALGTITDRDLAVRVLAEDLPTTTAVEEIMSEDLVTCRPKDDLREAERHMRDNQVSRILVVDDDGKL